MDINVAFGVGLYPWTTNANRLLYKQNRKKTKINRRWVCM